MSAAAGASRARALRVAIVGLGPKGMFAVERLLDHASGLDGGARIEVDAFEPHPVAGAGPVYDPDQPSFLRMNFTADAVDMWWPSSCVVPRDERLSFVAWREAQGSDGDGGSYPPRALVGRYLADGLATIVRHAPPNTRIRARSSRVQALALVPGGGGWRVIGRAGSDGPYDEVLIATGHERSSDRGLAAGWTHAAALVPSVFPVGRWLSPELIGVRTTIAIRGFALSFIDAALALTEGRGDCFEALDHPYRLRYRPSDRDAGVILPFSRTGRPMLAKPDPALAAAVPELPAIAEAGRKRILRLADGCDVQHDLLAILSTTAQSSLLAAGGGASTDVAASAAAWLAGAVGGRPQPAGCSPADELERSLAVGAGLHLPDLQWALGHTWRALYPALVCRFGAGGLAERQWPAFRRLAAEMERVAFGPPACNAAKLLALIEAGRIDLTHVRGARLRTQGSHTALRSEQGEHGIDVVIDAVLPGPGARGLDSELLAGLVDDGHARVLPGRRGLDVDADGGCRDADGCTTPGLSAIGRPTEDAVIGNDTLSRTLHPLADLWARRVASRCNDEAATSRVVEPYEHVP